jgi:hypothetical protein
MSSRIHMTSAIQGMSIRELRTGMSEMRHILNSQTESEPFNLSCMLANGYPIWKFAFDVSMGLHKKRSSRKKK